MHAIYSRLVGCFVTSNCLKVLIGTEIFFKLKLTNQEIYTTYSESVECCDCFVR